MIEFLNLIIFAKRMAFPIVRHKETAQIGMLIENYTIEIESFTLVPVGGSPHSANRLNVQIVFCAKGFENNLVLVNDGSKVIYNAKGSVVVIHST